ncbi:hypothetical protein, partial [Enterocloster clostridioformis]|uniref:hypothetical protein n=1 Tax=Enterocloster clostridioformis TaxID=1531 RepID=UPI0034A4F82C
IELLCTDYNKKATSIHYYFGNAVLGQCAYTEAGSSQGTAGIPMVGGRTGIRVIGWERFGNSGEIFKVQEKGRMEQR